MTRTANLRARRLLSSPYDTPVGYMAAGPVAMTRALYWIAGAAVSGVLLIAVLAMHALIGPHPADAASTMGRSAMTGPAQTPSRDAAPTGTVAAAVSATDTSMFGHTPCVAILRGHALSPVPGQLSQVGVLVDSVNSAGAGEAGLVSSQRAPPPGAALMRLCISRT